MGSLASKISVIIPSYQDAACLWKSLPPIVEQAGNNIEIIVVDSSPKPLASDLIKAFPHVRFEQSKKQLFAGAARNFGVKLCDRSILCFLDVDCFWNPGWFSSLERTDQKYPNWKALNGQVLYEDTQELAAFALFLMEFHEYTASISFQPRFLHSGNLVIRRDVFEASKGFREDIPMYEDFSFHSKLDPGVGKDFHYIPELRITHMNHFVEKQALKKKIFIMGSWRARIDQQLPPRMRFEGRLWYGLCRRSRSLLGFAFFVAIQIRALRLRSVYLSAFILRALAVLSACTMWAKGFQCGLDDEQAPLDNR